MVVTLSVTVMQPSPDRLVRDFDTVGPSASKPSASDSFTEARQLYHGFGNLFGCAADNNNLTV